MQRKGQSKVGTIPQDSISRMKRLLPAAACNVLTSCFDTFQKNSTKDFRSLGLETSVTPFGICEEMMNNVCRDHTVYFKMPDNRHYYI